ncbi:hypothetical protein ACFWFI_35265 [Streptomyces sp. NPDC060209]|uniref:hypothetical protein n=1 Tax=Streptomyces sp. NPDC060209 TaxID=3347073 RepID=UPI00365C0AEE
MTGGRNDYRTEADADADADGWTLRTIDGSHAAHIEHTIAITEDGPAPASSPSPTSNPLTRGSTARGAPTHE